MAKKTQATKAVVKAVQTLREAEQTTLRLLLALREEANAQASAANANVRNYLIQLLTSRGLDPQKWGVSPDMTVFTEIQQPQPPATPPPVPGGPQTFAESAPTPAPAAPPAA